MDLVSPAEHYRFATSIIMDGPFDHDSSFDRARLEEARVHAILAQTPAATYAEAQEV